MIDYSIDKLREKTGSAYKLVILAARRALELSDNAMRLVDMPVSSRVQDIALREILEDKITFKAK